MLILVRGIYPVFFFGLFLLSCKQPGKKPVESIPATAWILANSLDSIAPLAARKEISSMNSLASCVSPRGKYTTLVKADTTGYIYFRQDYSYRPEPFEAETWSDTSGMQMGNPAKALPREAINMVRSHAFHYLLLHPGRFFHDWGTPDTVRQKGALYYRVMARDFLEKPVTLLFGVQSGRMESLSFPDPEEPAGKISIRFSDWKKAGYYLLPRKVAIDQSGKTFSFDFTGIRFNGIDLK